MPVSEAYVKEILEDRQRVYKGLHEQIRANRALRYRKNPIKIPDAYKNSTQETRVPIIADVLFRVVATLTTDDPVITVPPYAATDKAKRNASLRERWSQAALQQMMRMVSRDILRMGIDAAVSDSVGVFKLMDRKDIWKNFPKRKEDEEAEAYLDRSDKFTKGQPFPFHWVDVDPLNVFPVPGPYGICEVLEVSKRPLLPVLKQLRVKYTPDGYERMRVGEPMPESQNSGQEIEFTEHWSDEGVTYLIDGKKADYRHVAYGRPPYFLLGGHMTSSRKPDEMYQSVIQPFAHLIPALEGILTAMTNWMWITAYPFLVKDVPDSQIMAGPTDPTSVVEIEAGKILQGVKFMEAPATAKALTDMVGLFMQMIDRSGLAAVMYGQGASSSSGYMVSQLMTAAQLVYAPIVDNVRMALEEMVPFMWQLIERRLKRKVFVWGAGSGKGQGDWLGLGPEDIDGYYACEVTLKPILPMDEIGQRDSAIRMVESGLWPKEFAREKLGHEQPEELADQIAVERYIESPRIDEIIIQDAAERAGLIKPQPPQPVQPAAPPVILGPDGMPIQGGIGGPGMPEVMGVQPSIPGQTMPLVPPMPQGVGGPPVVLQRQPGGPNQSGPGPV